MRYRIFITVDGKQTYQTFTSLRRATSVFITCVNFLMEMKQPLAGASVTLYAKDTHCVNWEEIGFYNAF
jgi:hypothetical protein